MGISLLAALVFSSSSITGRLCSVPEFCYSAPKSEVREKGYTLVPSRYIEFINRDAELKELLVAEEESKKDLLEVFKELGYEIEL